MNLAQAEKELSGLRAVLLGRFCPLTKDLCRKDCIAYYEGDVREDSYKKEVYCIRQPCCSSTLITGVVVVE